MKTRITWALLMTMLLGTMASAQNKISGGGTYKCTGSADGQTCEVEGEYTLPKQHACCRNAKGAPEAKRMVNR